MNLEAEKVRFPFFKSTNTYIGAILSGIIPFQRKVMNEKQKLFRTIRRILQFGCIGLIVLYVIVAIAFYIYMPH